MKTAQRTLPLKDRCRIAIHLLSLIITPHLTALNKNLHVFEALVARVINNEGAGHFIFFLKSVYVGGGAASLHGLQWFI